MSADASMARKAYVLALISVVMSFSVMDRALFGVVQEAVKNEFSLSDFQLGVIGGPAFAVVYALGSPLLARLIERYNRAYILGACVAVWSAMTMLSGVAGSFVHLILARLGVGASESGCTPASHSLLSDYFSPAQRAMALSICSAGAGSGVLVAGVVGGLVTQQYGWRATMLLMGGAGLLLAPLVWLTVRDPIRGARRRSVPFVRAIRILGRTRSYRHAVMLLTGAILVSAGIGQFTVSFLVRAHHLSFADAATTSGAGGGAAVIGGVVSGWLIHRLGRRHSNMLLWVPGVAMLFAAPAWIVGFSTPSAHLAVPLIVAGFFFFAFQLGPTFAIPQLAVPRAIRPTATALMLLAGTLLGQALGGPLIGYLSDTVSNMDFIDGGLDCHRVTSSLCAEARGEGLRIALILWSGLPLVMALNFWAAGRHFPSEARRYSS